MMVEFNPAGNSLIVRNGYLQHFSLRPYVLKSANTGSGLRGEPALSAFEFVLGAVALWRSSSFFLHSFAWSFFPHSS